MLEFSENKLPYLRINKEVLKILYKYWSFALIAKLKQLKVAFLTYTTTDGHLWVIINVLVNCLQAMRLQGVIWG